MKQAFKIFGYILAAPFVYVAGLVVWMLRFPGHIVRLYFKMIADLFRIVRRTSSPLKALLCVVLMPCNIVLLLFALPCAPLAGVVCGIIVALFTLVASLVAPSARFGRNGLLKFIRTTFKESNTLGPLGKTSVAEIVLGLCLTATLVFYVLASYGIFTPVVSLLTLVGITTALPILAIAEITAGVGLVASIIVAGFVLGASKLVSYIAERMRITKRVNEGVAQIKLNKVNDASTTILDIAKTKHYPRLLKELFKCNTNQFAGVLIADTKLPTQQSSLLFKLFEVILDNKFNTFWRKHLDLTLQAIQGKFTDTNNTQWNKAVLTVLKEIVGLELKVPPLYELTVRNNGKLVLSNEMIFNMLTHLITFMKMWSENKSLNVKDFIDDDMMGLCLLSRVIEYNSSDLTYRLKIQDLRGWPARDVRNLYFAQVTRPDSYLLKKSNQLADNPRFNMVWDLLRQRPNLNEILAQHDPDEKSLLFRVMLQGRSPHYLHSHSTHNERHVIPQKYLEDACKAKLSLGEVKQLVNAALKSGKLGPFSTALEYVTDHYWNKAKEIYNWRSPNGQTAMYYALLNCAESVDDEVQAQHNKTRDMMYDDGARIRQDELKPLESACANVKRIGRDAFIGDLHNTHRSSIHKSTAFGALALKMRYVDEAAFVKKMEGGDASIGSTIQLFESALGKLQSLTNGSEEEAHASSKLNLEERLSSLRKSIQSQKALSVDFLAKVLCVLDQSSEREETAGYLKARKQVLENIRKHYLSASSKLKELTRQTKASDWSLCQASMGEIGQLVQKCKEEYVKLPYYMLQAKDTATPRPLLSPENFSGDLSSVKQEMLNNLDARKMFMTPIVSWFNGQFKKTKMSFLINEIALCAKELNSALDEKPPVQSHKFNRCVNALRAKLQLQSKGIRAIVALVKCDALDDPQQRYVTNELAQTQENNTIMLNALNDVKQNEPREGQQKIGEIIRALASQEKQIERLERAVYRYQQAKIGLEEIVFKHHSSEKEASSQCTPPQANALIWLAIHDKAVVTAEHKTQTMKEVKDKSDIQDLEETLWGNLYDIQRDPALVDKKRVDGRVEQVDDQRKIIRNKKCPGGVFNKIVKTLDRGDPEIFVETGLEQTELSRYVEKRTPSGIRAAALGRLKALPGIIFAALSEDKQNEIKVHAKANENKLPSFFIEAILCQFTHDFKEELSLSDFAGCVESIREYIQFDKNWQNVSSSLEDGLNKGLMPFTQKKFLERYSPKEGATTTVVTLSNTPPVSTPTTRTTTSSTVKDVKVTPGAPEFEDVLHRRPSESEKSGKSVGGERTLNVEQMREKRRNKFDTDAHTNTHSRSI